MDRKLQALRIVARAPARLPVEINEGPQPGEWTSDHAQSERQAQVARSDECTG